MKEGNRKRQLGRERKKKLGLVCVCERERGRVEVWRGMVRKAGRRTDVCVGHYCNRLIYSAH